VVAVRAVVFDIGGVLGITPDLGVAKRWEAWLGLRSGAFRERMSDVWTAGGVGALAEAQVYQALADRLGLDEPALAALTADIWEQYLGTANTELIAYARGLRPRYRTGILSNSFVGAREREQVAYGFADLVDDIVYSHEVGMGKPDPRVYRLACDRLGVRPDETVFLDDVAESVAAAREVGISAVQFRDNAQAIAAIDALLAEPGASGR
jgi:epoxide hydrolase-like predicted phosphatase